MKLIWYKPLSQSGKDKFVDRMWRKEKFYGKAKIELFQQKTNVFKVQPVTWRQKLRSRCAMA